uniref:N-acetylgalactosaminide beta-1,3-galactosyltransferase n=1 Tax=Plectus sambesii TaxID=2011161 RepID=A0A914XNB7_9BILA
MTAQRYHLERAKYLRDTWPPRCDQHFFFTDNNSGQDESRFINVFQELKDGYDHLWPKTQAALRYINKHYADDFDWFLKADDDTYVIIENLRKFLSRFNKSAHHYSGHRLKYELVHGHNSGGSGYIMSRSTLKLLVSLLPNKTICPGGWAEDKEVARCLANVGIYPTDTLDDKNRDRFVHMHPAHYMYQLLGVTAKELISPEVISIHQLQPAEYRLLDLFLYHVRRANLTTKRPN